MCVSSWYFLCVHVFTIQDTLFLAGFLHHSTNTTRFHSLHVGHKQRLCLPSVVEIDIIS